MQTTTPAGGTTGDFVNQQCVVESFPATRVRGEVCAHELRDSASGDKALRAAKHADRGDETGWCRYMRTRVVQSWMKALQPVRLIVVR